MRFHSSSCEWSDRCWRSSAEYCRRSSNMRSCSLGGIQRAMRLVPDDDDASGERGEVYRIGNLLQKRLTGAGTVVTVCLNLRVRVVVDQGQGACAVAGLAASGFKSLNLLEPYV